MTIDDKLGKALDELAASARFDVGKEVIKLVVSLSPLGKALDKVMSGAAQRRLIERIVEVFEEVKSQLDKAGEAQIQEEYFMTEEFQTLLTLVLQELQTTHDRTKLRMLATALSNSSQIKFQYETRKELFVRTLRALSPEHIQLLNSLASKQITHEEFAKSEDSLKDYVNENGYSLAELNYLTSSYAWKAGYIKAFPIIQAPKGERLLLLQNLAGNGLVEEAIGQKVSRRESRIKKKSNFTDLVTGFTPSPTGIPVRCFKLSTFGEQFLAFVSRGTV